VADAKYVICPMCKSIALISPRSVDASNRDYKFGAGLGFTLENLQQWQLDIVQQRHSMNRQKKMF
jgi:hypothetical protein